MRDLFRREVNPEWVKMLKADESGLVMFFYSSPGIYLLYSYSGIYLVVEGWRDLGLKDPDIEKLIQSPFVEKLRRFRNATFHYQREVLSMKHLEFFGTEEERTEIWLNELYRAFERFFKENTLQLPDELTKTFTDNSSVEIVQAIKDWWNSEKSDALKRLTTGDS